MFDIFHRNLNKTSIKCMLFLFCILTSPLDGLVPKRFSSNTTAMLYKCRNMGYQNRSCFTLVCLCIIPNTCTSIYEFFKKISAESQQILRFTVLKFMSSFFFLNLKKKTLPKTDLLKFKFSIHQVKGHGRKWSL